MQEGNDLLRWKDLLEIFSSLASKNIGGRTLSILDIRQIWGLSKVEWILKYVTKSDRKHWYATNNNTPYEPTFRDDEAPIEPFTRAIVITSEQFSLTCDSTRPRGTWLRVIFIFARAQLAVDIRPQRLASLPRLNARTRFADTCLTLITTSLVFWLHKRVLKYSLQWEYKHEAFQNIVE